MNQTVSGYNQRLNNTGNFHFKRILHIKKKIKVFFNGCSYWQGYAATKKSFIFNAWVMRQTKHWRPLAVQHNSTNLTTNESAGCDCHIIQFLIQIHLSVRDWFERATFRKFADWWIVGFPLITIVVVFCQWKPNLLPTFFKMSSFVFSRIKKCIKVWINIRVSNWWQNFDDTLMWVLKQFGIIKG